MNGYYLIWSYEHRAWWRDGKMGYTRRIEEAGRYEESEVGDIVCNPAGIHEIAIPEDMARLRGEPLYHPYKGDRVQCV